MIGSDAVQCPGLCENTETPFNLRTFTFRAERTKDQKTRQLDFKEGCSFLKLQSQFTCSALKKYYRCAAIDKGSYGISRITIPKPSSSLTESKVDLLNSGKSLCPLTIVWRV